MQAVVLVHMYTPISDLGARVAYSVGKSAEQSSLEQVSHPLGSPRSWIPTL